MRGADGWRRWSWTAKSNEIPAERPAADNVASIDARYYLLSAEFSAERLSRVVRSHWAIENSLHWVLDVSTDEDQARNRKGNSAACLAVVRWLAPNIARMHPDSRSVAASSSTPSAATISARHDPTHPPCASTLPPV